MSTEEIQHNLKRLLRRYLAVRLFEILLLSVGAGLAAVTVCSFVTPSSAIAFGIIVAVGVMAARVVQLKLFQIDEHSIMRYVNRQLPQLQESGDLLLRSPNDLSLLEQLQQIRTAREFADSIGTVKLPHRLLVATVALVAGVVFAVVGFLLVNHTAKQTGERSYTQTTISDDTELHANVRQVDLRISPPGYTQLPEQRTQIFPITAPENSKASWTISFTSPVTASSLIFDGKDTINLRATSDGYTAHRIIQTAGFYQLMWTKSSGERKHSDFYPVVVKKDSPPILKIDNLDQFVQLEAALKISVDLKASMSDDYGIADAYIVATVSKGSGEGIKFREERLRFDVPSKISGKKIAATRRIDLVKLGLDPGDELYYYIEAFDNKVPRPNRARTETYFIAVKDTSEMTTSVDPGLGVDLMPEYFRSQRQIIIDTEKLLKEKKQISTEKFNARSNELAHDEKVLRLRYGEFLGEEFETNIGPAAGNEISSDDDIVKQYGHQHDTDEEHAARVEAPAKQEAGHSHDHNEEKESDPSKAYMHVHDSEEEATFFTQSIRAKLKAAVTIMWDAELYLRLYTPEKSLPYQYQALKLLKEISQDSRIYVHRTGFDPPPLKEDKRLSGDLTEAKGTSANTHAVGNNDFAAVRRALVWLESGPVEEKLSTSSRELLSQAAAELSTAAIQQPGRYLKALSQLRAWTDSELSTDQLSRSLPVIRAAFTQVLPAKALQPLRRERSTHPLDDRFLDKYDALPKESSQ